MDAFVASSLEQHFDDQPPIAVGRFSSKFTDVHHLYFPPWNSLTLEPCYGNVMTFCEAFSRACHVELSETDHLLRLFDPIPAQELGSGSRSRRPIDLWTELDGLTLRACIPGGRKPTSSQLGLSIDKHWGCGGCM